MAVLITNSVTAGRLAVSAPPIRAAPAMTKNQAALAGENFTVAVAHVADVTVAHA